MQIGTYMGFAITACVLTVFMFITYCIALVDYSHIRSCKSYHYSYFKVYCYSASKRHIAAVGAGLGSCLLICTVVQFILALTASIYCLLLFVVTPQVEWFVLSADTLYS